MILDILAKLSCEDPALKDRLINGSDYPLPGVSWFNPTEWLYEAGAIDIDDKKSLDEIYHYNPLLFDFVMKRTIRDPRTKKRLPESVFVSLDALREKQAKR